MAGITLSSSEELPPSSSNPFSFSSSVQPPSSTLRDSAIYSKPEATFEKFAFESNDDIGKVEMSGAAASLRARLLKIRGKSKETDLLGSLPNESAESGFSAEYSFDNGLAAMRELLEMAPPLHEDDECLQRCIKYLKHFHYSLSRQLHPELRNKILSNESATIETLTR
jgi:hypothetical protein